MKYKQQFTIDISGIMNDPSLVRKEDVQPFLRDQLVESYSPVLKKFETFLATNKTATHFSDAEKDALLALIEDQLTDILPKETSLEDFLKNTANLTGGSNSNLASHYAYMHDAISKNNSKAEISNELTERFSIQFIKDFPFRHHAKIIDQNGREISADINQEILEEMGLIGKESMSQKEQKIFTSKLVEKVGISPAQMQYLQARYNQRSLGAFSSSLGMKSETGIDNIKLLIPREEIWTININENGKRNLDKLEIKATTCNDGYERDEDGSILKDRYGVYNPTGVEIPYADIALSVDLSSLIEQKPSGFPFPTQLVPETISAAIYNDPLNKKYRLPKELEFRISNKNILPQRTLDKDDLEMISRTLDVEKNLSKDDLKTFIMACRYSHDPEVKDTLITKAMLTKFIQNEINSPDDKNEKTTKIMSALNIDDDNLKKELENIIDPAKKSIFLQMADKAVGISQSGEIDRFTKNILDHINPKAETLNTTMPILPFNIKRGFFRSQ